MNRVLVIGTVLTTAGLTGYLIGIVARYPGRSASIVGIMAGVTLTVIGLGGLSEAIEP